MNADLTRSASAAAAFAIALGIVTALATPARAAPLGAIDEERNTTVGTVDLDLARDADRRQLDRRIEVASRNVCAGLGAGRLTIAQSRCQRQAIRSAEAQVAVLIDRAERLAAAATAPGTDPVVLTIVAPER